MEDLTPDVGRSAGRTSGPRGSGNNPRVLAVIPARGGSKGVPRKNIREVGGRPLLEWTIDTALAGIEAGLITRCIVTTDDPEITEIARAAGAEVPFKRPPEISSDQTKMLPVLQDAVRRAEQEDGPYDWILLLQPTNPFRTLEDIEGALEAGMLGDCDSVISVVRVFAVHPMLMKKVVDGVLEPWSVPEPEGTRRQDYDPPAYMRNGAIYLTRRDVLMAGSIWGERIRPYEMPEARSVGIDSELELKLVDLLLRERDGG